MSVNEALFDNHIAKPYEMKVKRPDTEQEDSFFIPPLPYEHLPKIFDIVKSLEKSSILDIEDEDSEEKAREMFQNLDTSVIKSIADLGYIALKLGYPDVSEEKLKLFVATNLFDIFVGIVKTNISKMGTGTIENVKKERLVNDLGKSKSA